MSKNWSLITIIGLVFALCAGPSAPIRADILGCQGQVNCAPSPAAHGSGRYTDELVAQRARRPQITVHPRPSYPGPNAKRYCRFWLAQENRVSGTVIVPRQQCWWQ